MTDEQNEAIVKDQVDAHFGPKPPPPPKENVPEEVVDHFIRMAKAPAPKPVDSDYERKIKKAHQSPFYLPHLSPAQCPDPYCTAAAPTPLRPRRLPRSDDRRARSDEVLRRAGPALGFQRRRRINAPPPQGEEEPCRRHRGEEATAATEGRSPAPSERRNLAARSSMPHRRENIDVLLRRFEVIPTLFSISPSPPLQTLGPTLLAPGLLCHAPGSSAAPANGHALAYALPLIWGGAGGGGPC
nr:uncharacterized protein LOC109774584 [Aegilops tauschii subsp. strangulata]